MKPLTANEIGYEAIEIFGKKGIFTNMHDDHKTLPLGLYAYDLRDECDGHINELKTCVRVIHWSTVIIMEPIADADDGIDVTENDYQHLGADPTLAEFVAKDKYDPILVVV